jgi:glycerophosphoryl diester phosphodiesterase
LTYHAPTSKRTYRAIATLVAASFAWPATALDLQGHRGARGLAPENTLAAFARALELGVDTLELDLGVTADDVLVVLHDPALNPAIARLDGAWLRQPTPIVRELSLAELKRYDVGRLDPTNRYASRYPEQEPVDGERIPTLAEVVELTRQTAEPAVSFNIETKLSPREPDLTPSPERFAELVVTEVRRLGITERATIQSFDWRTLRIVNELAPEIDTVCLTAQQSWLDNIELGRPGGSAWLGGLDVDDHGGSVPRLVEAAGCSVWSPYFGDLTEARLEEAHALGLQVVVWTVNELADMRRLIAMGVDGIISDYPDRLIEVAAE